MQYVWTIDHLSKIADQVHKRWQSNPSSVKPGHTWRKGNEQLDYSWLNIDDVKLAIKLDGPRRSDSRVYIDLKGHNGGIDRPNIFRYRARKKYNEAVEKIKSVQCEMKFGPADKGDKLICEAFPEAFEEFLVGK